MYRLDGIINVKWTASVRVSSDSVIFGVSIYNEYRRLHQNEFSAGKKIKSVKFGINFVECMKNYEN